MNKSECKVHKPGCARTEGFYIMDNKQKTKKKVIFKLLIV